MEEEFLMLGLVALYSLLLFRSYLIQHQVQNSLLDQWQVFLLILRGFTSSYMNVVYCGISSALDWTFMD